LYVLIFKFLDRRREDKDAELYGSRHSPKYNWLLIFNNPT